jgi:hypothetical protein
MQERSLAANGEKKLEPLTYDSRPPAPAGAGGACGLKKNKKKMMLFRRSDTKMRFVSRGS